MLAMHIHNYSTATTTTKGAFGKGAFGKGAFYIGFHTKMVLTN